MIGGRELQSLQSIRSPLFLMTGVHLVDLKHEAKVNRILPRNRNETCSILARYGVYTTCC